MTRSLHRSVASGLAEWGGRFTARHELHLNRIGAMQAELS
jgi:hypothetical protein